MSKLADKWIDIFRAGNYGSKGAFTAQHIAQIAADYNPSLHESPVVIGHPKSNAPAFAWTKKLRAVGDLLQAQIGQVEPSFEEAFEAGRYKKRSASFYRDPSTGKLSLRHIGFLGAMPPDVKGLADFQFDDAGQEPTEVDFEEESMADETTILDRLLAKFEERFNKKATENSPVSFSEQQVKDFAKAAVIEAIAPLQAKLDQQATSFSEGQKASATAATKARAIDAVTKLKSKGKWVPAFDKSGLVVVFEELAKTEDVVEFGEGDAKKSVKPLDALVAFMEQLPAIVPTAPVYTGQTVGGTPVTKVAGINDTQRAPADPNSMTLDSLVQARSREAKIPYGTALAQVAAEKPELTIPGGAAAGTV